LGVAWIFGHEGGAFDGSGKRKRKRADKLLIYLRKSGQILISMGLIDLGPGRCEMR
jgi:hypothetical protein